MRDGCSTGQKLAVAGTGRLSPSQIGCILGSWVSFVSGLGVYTGLIAFCGPVCAAFAEGLMHCEDGSWTAWYC